MANNSIVVTVEIAGKKYDIKCPEHEKANLLKSAALVQKYMSEINGSNNEKKIVMAALKISHELILKQDDSCKDELEQTKSGLAQVTSFIDNINLILADSLQKNTE